MKPNEQELAQSTDQPEKSGSIDVLELPTVILDQETFDYLSNANPDGAHATGEEIAAFLAQNEITPGQDVIVTVDGQARVIDTSIGDFGTRNRGLTEQLQSMMSASGQEIADAFTADNSELSTEPIVDLMEIDGDKKSGAEMRDILKAHKARQIQEAEQAAEDLAVSIHTNEHGTDPANKSVVTEVDSTNEKSKLEAQLTELQTGLSDKDKMNIWRYSEAHDHEKGVYEGKISAQVTNQKLHIRIAALHQQIGRLSATS